MPKIPNKPHDEFFKAAFSRQEVAYDFLSQLLPASIRQELDLDQLQRLPGSFVGPNLNESFSDMVYRCPLIHSENEAWLPFIFEHKSSPERYPHLQLLRYILEVWDDQLKQGMLLTPIIPILVYHGKEQWHKKDLSSYFGADLPASLRPFVPDFDYILTDLQDWSEAQILALRRGLLINAFLMMKYIWQPEYILEHAELFLIHLDQQSGDFVISILAYLFRNSEIASDRVKKFIQKLPTQLNKTAMSTYDMILEEGRIEGEIKGKIEGKQEGRIEGKIEGRIEARAETLWEAVKSLIQLNCTDDFIQNALPVDQDFINRVKANAIPSTQNNSSTFSPLDDSIEN